MDISPGSVGKTTVTANLPVTLVIVPDPAATLEPGLPEELAPGLSNGIASYPNSVATAVSALLAANRP